MTPLPQRLAALAVLVALGGCAFSESLPDSPYPERLYGDWALAPEYCAEGWWRFSEDRVDTAGGLACEVDDIYTSLENVPIATYELECEAEGIDSEPSWTVTLQPDESLYIDRHDGAGALRFRRCGPPPGRQPSPS